MSQAKGLGWWLILTVVGQLTNNLHVLLLLKYTLRYIFLFLFFFLAIYWCLPNITAN